MPPTREFVGGGPWGMPAGIYAQHVTVEVLSRRRPDLLGKSFYPDLRGSDQALGRYRHVPSWVVVVLSVLDEAMYQADINRYVAIQEARGADGIVLARNALVEPVLVPLADDRELVGAMWAARLVGADRVTVGRMLADGLPGVFRGVP